MPDIVKEYEAIGIVSPELGEQDLTQLQQQFSEQVARHRGRILESSSLGKKRLSFRMRRATEGIYLQWVLQLPPGEVAGLKKAVGLMEPILRWMLTRKQEGAPMPQAGLTAAREDGEETNGQSE